MNNLKRILKLFIFLIITTTTVTNVGGCNQERIKLKELVDREIVKEISNFNSKNDWNLIINNKSNSAEIKKQLQAEIFRKLSLNLQEEFKKGKFIIFDFFNDKNEVLNNSYFIKQQTKNNLEFCFSFNNITSNTNINLEINNTKINRIVVDYISQIKFLEIKMPRNLDNGLQMVKTKLLNQIINNLESKIRHYFYQGNLEINNFFYDDNIVLTNEYFKVVQPKTEIIFTFIFDRIKSEAKFNLTVTYFIYEEDIINYVNQLEFLELKIHGYLENGVSEIKSLIFLFIKNQIFDEQLVDYFENYFQIVNILYNDKSITDNFFYFNCLKRKLQLQYSFNDDIGFDNIEIIKTVNFYLTINLENREKFSNKIQLFF